MEKISKTIELRKQLQLILRQIIDDVFYEIAPAKTLYPYLVYEIRELYSENGKTVITLEVNVLDYGTSTSAIEILSDNVQRTLHKAHFINDKIQFSIYKTNRITVQEEDRKTIRRRMLFELQLHELREE